MAAAFGSGVLAALAGVSVFRRVKAMRKRAVVPQLSREDKQAITRMEGEGGPNHVTKPQNLEEPAGPSAPSRP